jgi:hypothetical protein
MTTKRTVFVSILFILPLPSRAIASAVRRGIAAAPGVTLLTGRDYKELADPYLTQLPNSVIISGTAHYYLRFHSVSDVFRGGPYRVIWSEFFYPNGTPMEGGRFAASSWDMKPALWSREDSSRLWDPRKDKKPPQIVWYGGHMRPLEGMIVSRWPEDNYSRDVFAFVEKSPGKWVSEENSIFASRRDWPRMPGNFKGHRYGHQIIATSNGTPAVFFEEVIETRSNGAPLTTAIFMDHMSGPFKTEGKPIELISPINAATGKPFPSATREDGSSLVEGPLYFKFRFGGEAWEAIGFSAGSYYGRYPSCFAARRVSDGLREKPYRLDLTDDGSDLHDAGAALGALLRLTGGPGRPSVVVDRNGVAIPNSHGKLQILFHAYRRDILPDHHEKFREVYGATLQVHQRKNGTLRFQITPRVMKRARSLPVKQEARRYDSLQSTLLHDSAFLAQHHRSSGTDSAAHRSGFQSVLHRWHVNQHGQVECTVSDSVEG